MSIGWVWQEPRLVQVQALVVSMEVSSDVCVTLQLCSLRSFILCSYYPKNRKYEELLLFIARFSVSSIPSVKIRITVILFSPFKVDLNISTVTSTRRNCSGPYSVTWAAGAVQADRSADSRTSRSHGSGSQPHQRFVPRTGVTFTYYDHLV